MQRFWDALLTLWWHASQSTVSPKVGAQCIDETLVGHIQEFRELAQVLRFGLCLSIEAGDARCICRQSWTRVKGLDKLITYMAAV